MARSTESRPAPGRASVPLTREDWLLAGQELLRAGGVAAVKLGALTDRVGATTGSFYHHFVDMQEYLDCLARHYGTEQVDAAIAAASQQPDPVARIRLTMTASRRRRMRPLDNAMRVWAAGNPTARASVRRTDERILELLEAAFDDLGFSRHQSLLRARMLWSLHVAQIYAPWEKSEADIDEILRVLVARPTG